MREWLRCVREGLKKNIDLRDIFVFGGLAAAVYGVAAIHVPAAWIVAGVTLFYLGKFR